MEMHKLYLKFFPFPALLNVEKNRRLA